MNNNYFNEDFVQTRKFPVKKVTKEQFRNICTQFLKNQINNGFELWMSEDEDITSENIFDDFTIQDLLSSMYQNTPLSDREITCIMNLDNLEDIEMYETEKDNIPYLQISGASDESSVITRFLYITDKGIPNVYIPVSGNLVDRNTLGTLDIYGDPDKLYNEFKNQGIKISKDDLEDIAFNDYPIYDKCRKEFENSIKII